MDWLYGMASLFLQHSRESLNELLTPYFSNITSSSLYNDTSPPAPSTVIATPSTLRHSYSYSQLSPHFLMQPQQPSSPTTYSGSSLLCSSYSFSHPIHPFHSYGYFPSPFHGYSNSRRPNRVVGASTPVLGLLVTAPPSPTRE